ncbi:TadE/TadG family type IV pilus assembly protein [Microvirga sp. VF16]|uniref:TadE/TadG family type IV pilus assembly protein n=1 Tax=Microvirga sp. VF16 TaxID=2807101 RepID=UPI00193DB70C|nr:TadE family protein [Microvirga sp. VF16]QRM27646.1 pilus assembly protein [Microvirga sp. VF16]
MENERGLSAIEFALIVPLFVIGFVMTADIGLAAHQRMTIDHVLRAGAQSAMMDPGASTVQTVLETVAGDTFAIGSSTPSGGKPPLTFTIERYCVCPSNQGAKVLCSTICTGTAPATLAFYSLSGSSTYTGMLIPNLRFSPTLEVEVR